MTTPSGPTTATWRRTWRYTTQWIYHSVNVVRHVIGERRDRCRQWAVGVGPSLRAQQAVGRIARRRSVAQRIGHRELLAVGVISVRRYTAEGIRYRQGVPFAGVRVVGGRRSTLFRFRFLR